MTILLSNIQKRILMFLGICIPLRFALTYLAKVINVKYLPLLGSFYLAMGIVMLYLFFTQSRLYRDWMDGEIWWKNLRPIHAILYIVFGLLAFNKNKKAWVILLADTLFGLLVFFLHHGKFGIL